MSPVSGWARFLLLPASIPPELCSQTQGQRHPQTPPRDRWLFSHFLLQPTTSVSKNGWLRRGSDWNVWQGKEIPGISKWDFLICPQPGREYQEAATWPCTSDLALLCLSFPHCKIGRVHGVSA